MREENECEGMKTIKQKKVMSRVLYIVSICLIVGLIVEGCSQKKSGRRTGSGDGDGDGDREAGFVSCLKYLLRE